MKKAGTKDKARKKPNTPEHKACKKVAPKNRKTLTEKTSPNKKVGPKENKIRIFSEAAKPRAQIIIYKRTSTGSSKAGLFKTFPLTTKYFRNSSTKATPIKIFKIDKKIGERFNLDTSSRIPISIRMAGTAATMP